ncbi:MAG: RNA polymerase factor sigma-54 [Acidobacteriota bacterium]|nr:RNA polymerase factor sigma-54 [Acidobacteriota bacterium]
MSLKLTQRLDQRMVLTPQLRQRIEMLQMTSIELNDLIQQEMLVNPVLEEVQSQDEVREISENIIDQYADGNSGDILPDKFEDTRNGYEETFESSLNQTNGNGQIDSIADLPEYSAGEETATAGNFDEEFSEDFHEAGNDSFEEVDFGREFQEYLDPGYRTQEIEYKEDVPSFEQFLTRSKSLSEHLEWQLRLQPLSERLLEAALCVIGNLDKDGRLVATNEEIAAFCGCTIEDAEEARQIVTQLDPVGCGVRDLKECLLTQLKVKGLEDSFAAQLVSEHLHDLLPHKFGHLAKQLGCEPSEIAEEIKIIKSLEPYPGRQYDSDEPVYIAPEIYIEKIEGEYVIYFADDGSPRLRLSSTYQQMLDKNNTTKETKDFIKEKMRSAIDLLRNIEHRRQTIYRVVECIVERQRDFLDKGVQYLKPMMLKDVAEDIGMHLSTISRVVNRKYAYTPQGVIELRRFFSEGMLNEEGEEVSTRIIKLRIKKMIEEEDTHDPITDDQIAKILAKEGIKLSRRTVAKYRDQMNIPGSRERKTVV